MQKRTRMFCRALPTVVIGVSMAGCVNIDLPEQVSLLPGGTSFVVEGVARDRVDADCIRWESDLGHAFVLFQSNTVLNIEFDRVVTPGTRSRIQVRVRDDLVPLCDGTDLVVEVQRVLEVGE